MVALVSIMADRHKNYGKEGDQATGPEQIYYGKILRSSLEARDKGSQKTFTKRIEHTG